MTGGAQKQPTHRVYLALGTNLGDRHANLQAAIEALPPAVQVKQVSSIYETPPWGVTDQPAFLNMTLLGETDLEPLQLLKKLKELEARLGRQPGVRYGPRLIDLDILLYDDRTIDNDGLIIPHPRMHERAFVLVPLAEIAPRVLHPVLRKSITELRDSVDITGIIKMGAFKNAMLKVRQLRVAGRAYTWGERTLVMGIINVTADSFSGDGLLDDAGTPIDAVEAALAQARQFVAAGVDILDIGGESTRPGALPVTMEEELRRVLPVIRRLAAEMDVVISIDTYKAAVAEAALQAGAHIVNDVWGLKVDPDIAGAAARNYAPVIIMHNRSSWANAEIKDRLGGRYVGMEYNDLLGDICTELMESVALAHQAGIPDEHIILDPGIGFGKTTSQNLELIDRLNEIRELGYPLLLGPSRKSFIGYTLNLPPDQRMEGTAVAVAVGIVRGADIVRVHDVEPLLRVVRMTDAIIRRNVV